MDAYEDIIKHIIVSQKKIIGPVAIDEANNSGCVKVDANLKNIELLVEGSQAVERLIQQYAVLFGMISIEVSKEAISSYAGENKLDLVLPQLT